MGMGSKMQAHEPHTSIYEKEEGVGMKKALLDMINHGGKPGGGKPPSMHSSQQQLQLSGQSSDRNSENSSPMVQAPVV